MNYFELKRALSENPSYWVLIIVGVIALIFLGALLATYFSRESRRMRKRHRSFEERLARVRKKAQEPENSSGSTA